ncbi:MAG: thiamine phosphate synthase [Wolbachia sp.]
MLNLHCRLDVDGVHLGQADGQSRTSAWKLLSPNKIIGLSIESLDELEKINNLDMVTYVATSAVFPTRIKDDIKTLWGIGGLKSS